MGGLATSNSGYASWSHPSGLARLDSRPVVVRRLARVRWLAVATVEAVATEGEPSFLPG